MTERDSDEVLQSAVRRSRLAALPTELSKRLVENAAIIGFTKGLIVHRPGDSARVLLVVTGLLRHYLSALDGREVTACYLGPGAITGIFTLGGRDTAIYVQALSETEGVGFEPRVIEQEAREHPALAWAIQQEILARWSQLIEALCLTAFGTIRHRITRHLLAVASWDSETGRLVVRETHQEIANNVGTVREVVGRELRNLHADGLVELLRGCVVVSEPLRLQKELEVIVGDGTKVAVGAD